MITDAADGKGIVVIINDPSEIPDLLKRGMELLIKGLQKYGGFNEMQAKQFGVIVDDRLKMKTGGWLLFWTSKSPTNSGPSYVYRPSEHGVYERIAFTTWMSQTHQTESSSDPVLVQPVRKNVWRKLGEDDE